MWNYNKILRNRHKKYFYLQQNLTLTLSLGHFLSHTHSHACIYVHAHRWEKRESKRADPQNEAERLGSKGVVTITTWLYKMSLDKRVKRLRIPELIVVANTPMFL